MPLPVRTGGNVPRQPEEMEPQLTAAAPQTQVTATVSVNSGHNFYKV